MKVKIGKSFYHKTEDITFEKGKIYNASSELAWWIVRKRLGEIIPDVNIKIPKEEVNPLKEITKPPKDKMVRKYKNK